MRYILAILNILALIVAILWLYYKPDFEPLLTCFGLLATLIALFFNNEAQKDKNKKIRTLCCELRENLNVAKGRQPWSTYSLKNRNIVEELRKIMGENLYKKISEIYLTLETTNVKINGVGRGWWGDNPLNSCYTKLVEPIKHIIDSLQEVKKFKKYLK